MTWYVGEVQALMGTAGTALDAGEDKQIRDGKSFVVYSEGQPSMHATGWVRQIQQDCRRSVHAELFHRAAELGMKTVVVAECGGRVPTHELGHNLGTVWRTVSKDRQSEINRIFDREYRQIHPASSASFGELAEETCCATGATTRNPCRIRTSPATCGRWHRPCISTT